MTFAPPTGHAAGLPGDVHPVRLRGAVLLGLPPGRHVRPHQQHHRDPQRRAEAVHRPAAALRTESGEHRPVAGQLLFHCKAFTSK